MSKRVVNSPEIEAKELFYSFNESYLFEYFFEEAISPDGISEEDYIEELKREYYKLKREEAKRLLGLE